MATEETPLVDGVSKEKDVPTDSTYNDEVEHMTLGRRIARYLSGFMWYNPHIDSDEDDETRPNLDSAWAYFEHVTLARHFAAGTLDREEARSLRKAEPGEPDYETRLYSVLATPEPDLGDFGVGVGVYFFTLRAMSIIMLIAGFINLPNIMYFLGDNYNSGGEVESIVSLRASAICTDKTWVACPSCKRSDWDQFPAVYSSYGESTQSDGTTLKFIKINNCDITAQAGIVGFASLIFACISFFVVARIATWKEKLFDDQQMTSTDFAVEVENPPKDARDPDEWKDFFSQFGHVTSLTVALDNEELLNALIERRELCIELNGLTPPGVDVDPTNICDAVEQARSLTWMESLMGYSDAETIKSKVEEIDASINDDLGHRKYDVSNVFVIFENEEAQRRALDALMVGGMAVFTNNRSKLQEGHAFRGENVLAVLEPAEPSAVRWNDLDESVLTKMLQRLLSFSLTAIFIIIACFVVSWVRQRYGIAYAAMAITAVNSIAPTVFAELTALESHSNEGSVEASNYYKITASLWILTTILTAFVTPFVSTLDNTTSSLIPAMYYVFITELVKTPITQVLDPWGHFCRHFLGPRAVDQRRMNYYFQGTEYQLSERYTDMTSMLFMTFYYAMIFPMGFFWAAGALAVHYWVDKFCLLRVWAPAPMVGKKIAVFSRLYFLSTALLVYAVMSSYNFASFPYDNACVVRDKVMPVEYVGTFNLTDGEGTGGFADISAADHVYKYCNQDMLRYKPWPAIPAVPASQPEGSEWMSDDQEFTNVFGWACFFVGFAILLIMLSKLRSSVSFFFFGRTVGRRSEGRTGFSKLLDIYAYVPQVKIDGALFPCLLCDVSEIDHELIGWEDPADPEKTSHNAIYDVPGLLDKEEGGSLFSIVKHWKPEE